MNNLNCTITYGQERIDFNVHYVDRKTMEIAVHPDRSVIIKAPHGTKLEEVKKRVIKRARWIKRQLDFFRQFEPRTPERLYVGGETHLYLGKQYRIKIINDINDGMKLTRGYFLITLKTNNSAEKIKKIINEWYSIKAQIHFTNSFNSCWPLFEKLNFEKPQLHVKRMKKRWGSLSKKGFLTLNTDLIRAPRECIDYVIIHELCHIKHHDHSQAFYQLLEKLMPDWKKRKHKLELALI